MCEAEEVLNWLLSELENKAVSHRVEVKSFARHLELNVSFMDRYEEERAVDSVWPLETVSEELSDLVREAKQRLKESGQQVAA
ncbi:hypothetical protein DSECCO2_470150 [anaerobic digester metagenome]